ncbi:MAG: Rieske (2Fe-2S) protein [Myxococcota bacterium]
MKEEDWAEWRSVEWDRRFWIRRVQALVTRYEAMAKGLRPSLLWSHPTAFREAQALPESERKARHQRAEDELRRLKAGAPLPAYERPRRLLHAAADLVWRMKELRRLSALRARPDAWSAYLAVTPEDPLPESPRAVAAWFDLAPARRLGVAVRVAEGRLKVRGLARWLFEGPGPRVDIGPVEGFGDGPRAVLIDGERYLVLRHEGRWTAIDGICPHRGGLLSEGVVEEGCVVCPIHSWKFALRDGQAVLGRGQLQLHRVELDEGRLWLHRSDG